MVTSRVANPLLALTAKPYALLTHDYPFRTRTFILFYSPNNMAVATTGDILGFNKGNVYIKYLRIYYVLYNRYDEFEVKKKRGKSFTCRVRERPLLVRCDVPSFPLCRVYPLFRFNHFQVSLVLLIFLV